MVMQFYNSDFVPITFPLELDQFLSLEERLEVSHLPYAHQYQHNTLTQRPPKNSCIRTVTNLTETLFTNLTRGSSNCELVY